MSVHEITIRATNARNESHEAHVEYTSHATDPETAAREVATELGKALGPGAVRIVDEDR